MDNSYANELKNAHERLLKYTQELDDLDKRNASKEEFDDLYRRYEIAKRDDLPYLPTTADVMYYATSDLTGPFGWATYAQIQELVATWRTTEDNMPIVLQKEKSALYVYYAGENRPSVNWQAVDEGGWRLKIAEEIDYDDIKQRATMAAREDVAKWSKHLRRLATWVS